MCVCVCASSKERALRASARTWVPARSGKVQLQVRWGSRFSPSGQMGYDPNGDADDVMLYELGSDAGGGHGR